MKLHCIIFLYLVTLTTMYNLKHNDQVSLNKHSSPTYNANSNKIKYIYSSSMYYPTFFLFIGMVIFIISSYLCYTTEERRIALHRLLMFFNDKTNFIEIEHTKEEKDITDKCVLIKGNISIISEIENTSNIKSLLPNEISLSALARFTIKKEIAMMIDNKLVWKETDIDFNLTPLISLNGYPLSPSVKNNLLEQIPLVRIIPNIEELNAYLDKIDFHLKDAKYCDEEGYFYFSSNITTVKEMDRRISLYCSDINWKSDLYSKEEKQVYTFFGGVDKNGDLNEYDTNILIKKDYLSQSFSVFTICNYPMCLESLINDEKKTITTEFGKEITYFLWLILYFIFLFFGMVCAILSIKVIILFNSNENEEKYQNGMSYYTKIYMKQITVYLLSLIIACITYLTTSCSLWYRYNKKIFFVKMIFNLFFISGFVYLLLLEKFN